MKKYSLKRLKINWSTFSILRKFEKVGKFKNMYFYEHVTRGLQTLYICKLYILHVWVVTAPALYHFLSPAKRYSWPWLCYWLFLEKTLWVACGKLFLEVLDNNNNNNNNNKDLPHPFLQRLFVLQKKTIKLNKNVKIHQCITVNAKNMTTKIVKGLKTDSDRKTKVKAR